MECYDEFVRFELAGALKLGYAIPIQDRVLLLSGTTNIKLITIRNCFLARFLSVD